MKRTLIAAALLLAACGSDTETDEIRLLPAEAFRRTVDGKAVELYTLRAGDIALQATNYGGRVVALWTPDREGRYEDIVLGYESLDRYIDNRGGTLPRGRRGSLCQPHRRGPLHARRQTVHAADERPRTDPPRRHDGVGPRRLGRGVGRRTAARPRLPAQGRRGGISREPPDPDDLLRDARERVPRRLRGDDRRSDGGEPLAPLLLQPQGRGQRHGARQRTDAPREPHDAGGLAAHPDGRNSRRHGHALRLPRTARHRRADRSRRSAVAQRPRIRPQLDRGPHDRRRRGSSWPDSASRRRAARSKCGATSPPSSSTAATSSTGRRSARRANRCATANRWPSRRRSTPTVRTTRPSSTTLRPGETYTHTCIYRFGAE